MAISVEATYEGGVLRPKTPLNVAEGAAVRLTVHPLEEPDDPLKDVIGIGESGRTDGAERHDKYLYEKTRP